MQALISQKLYKCRGRAFFCRPQSLLYLTHLNKIYIKSLTFDNFFRKCFNTWLVLSWVAQRLLATLEGSSKRTTVAAGYVYFIPGGTFNLRKLYRVRPFKMIWDVGNGNNFRENKVPQYLYQIMKSLLYPVFSFVFFLR